MSLALDRHPLTATTPPCSPSKALTRSLLGYGAVAGPVYVTTSLVQALVHDGFDPTRHSWSLLAAGPEGWVQAVNLIVSGAMVVAFAIGLARSGPGRWAPRLIAVFGIGMVAAGFLTADPMDGYPVGVPAPTSPTWHGIGHMVAGSTGFWAMVVAALLLGRTYARGPRGVRLVVPTDRDLLPRLHRRPRQRLDLAGPRDRLHPRRDCRLRPAGWRRRRPVPVGLTPAKAHHTHPGRITTVRYLSLLVGSQPDTPPPPELFEAIMTLGQDATASGVLLDMGGLDRTSSTRLSVADAKLSIVDGPFTETKELLSYAIYEVRTKEEAVEWSRRFMAIHRDLWPAWSGDTFVVPIMGGAPSEG